MYTVQAHSRLFTGLTRQSAQTQTNLYKNISNFSDMFLNVLYIHDFFIVLANVLKTKRPSNLYLKKHTCPV